MFTAQSDSNITQSLNILSAQELEEGLPAEEVHRRALEARKTLAHTQRVLSFWLVEMERRELYRHFGCSNVYQYAELYLELAPHTICEYLRSGKEMEKLPLLAAACARGEISPSKIREISRVATSETEEKWLSIALTSTYRQIEKLVPLTPKGELPPIGEKSVCSRISSQEKMQKNQTGKENEAHHIHRKEYGNESKTGKPEAPPPSRYRTKLVLELENDRMAIITKALEKAQEETGERDRCALIEYIARVFLESESSGTLDGAPYRITLHHIPETGIAWTEDYTGPKYVPESTLSEALCDAEIIDLREIPSMQAKSPGNSEMPEMDIQRSCCTGDTITTHPSKEPGSPSLCMEDKPRKKSVEKDPYRHGQRLRRSIPLTLRRQVLERDGRQCTAPGCGHRKYLSIHHIDPVAAGGKDRASNLTSTCGFCHRALHKGMLSVEGKAPGNLVWRNRFGAILKGSS